MLTVSMTLKWNGHHIGNGLFPASHAGFRALTLMTLADTMPAIVRPEPEFVLWRIRQRLASSFLFFSA
jgi:hypothetical protein